MTPPHSHGIGLSGAGTALLAAALFGVTTPLAKQLLAGANPLLIAGLLYAGSGLGLLLLILLRDRGRFSLHLARGDVLWLAAAIACGGVGAPALLMTGLASTDAATASLLLNLEAVLTAVLAWVLFREATSRRVVWGFVSIFAGTLALMWPTSLNVQPHPAALAAIAAACLCWAVDNNLTRKISGGDAPAIAAAKGLAAGSTNVGLALAWSASFPTAAKIAATLGLGFVGYGLSLVLFIVSLRNLGTARTGAYFATAPFIGSAVAIGLYGQPVSGFFWLAAALMGLGVWLHLTENHEHEHIHQPLIHAHPHTHDAHHQHLHEPGTDGSEPHTHEHRHEWQRHRHPHYPDIHHRHSHD